VNPSLIGYDSLAGITQVFHPSIDGDTYILENVQDAEDIVETNRALKNLYDERTPFADMERVASIPLVVYMDLEKRGIIDDDAAFRKWLNDKDNEFFRTRPGRI
jgi:hypothetical protein